MSDLRDLAKRLLRDIHALDVRGWFEMMSETDADDGSWAATLLQDASELDAALDAAPQDALRLAAEALLTAIDKDWGDAVAYVEERIALKRALGAGPPSQDAAEIG